MRALIVDFQNKSLGRRSLGSRNFLKGIPEFIFQTHTKIIAGRRSEQFGTVEAPNQREAYRLAIEKFDIPIERQKRLFVVKLDDKG